MHLCIFLCKIYDQYPKFFENMHFRYDHKLIMPESHRLSKNMRMTLKICIFGNFDMQFISYCLEALISQQCSAKIQYKSLHVILAHFYTGEKSARGPQLVIGDSNFLPMTGTQ